jgi:hypothetical protein
MSACNVSFVDLLVFPFEGYLRDVLCGKNSLQRLSVVLHGISGSYLRDAFQEGTAEDVAYLHVPRALACGGFLIHIFFYCCVNLV